MDASVDLVFKIAAIGIITVVLHQLLKSSNKDELAMMTSIAGLVVVLFIVVREINLLFTTIKSLFGL